MYQPVGKYFYPRSPYGERLHREQRTEFYAHFYPRSPYGERLLELIPLTDPTPISIHALLTESDYIDSEARTLVSYFYPRSPYGERHTSIAGRITLNDFYPRSPYGERRYKDRQNP